MGKTRRKWSDDEKRAIVEECARPGAILARIARKHEASSSQIYDWRKRFGPQEAVAASEEPIFLPVAIESEDKTGIVDTDAGVTIRFSNGHEMEFPVSANGAAMKRLLQVVSAL